MEFTYDAEGYKEAKKFLTETDNLGRINHELSTDGYTVVHLANSLYEAKVRAISDQI